MARTLQRYDLGAQCPRALGAGGTDVLQAFRRADDKVITGLFVGKVTAVAQVFWATAEGSVYVLRPGETAGRNGGRPQRQRDEQGEWVRRRPMTGWLKMIAEEAGRVRSGVVSEEGSWLDVQAVREALAVAQQAVELFHPELVEQSLRPQGTLWDWDGVVSVVAYTDGSVVHGDGGSSMGFGVVMEVRNSSAWGEHRRTAESKGRCVEGPHSPAVAELMAIAVVLAAVPAGLGVPACIYTDSQVAIDALTA
ncbi:hypothetical protein LPJ61_007064, partial [Coemansia biformis]